MRSERQRPPRSRPPVARDLIRRLVSWEGLLLAILAVIVVVTGAAVPGYLNPQNQINLLELSVEKAIVVLAMTFVIVSGEIDLSIASVMGLSAVLVAWLKEQGVPLEVGIVAALLVGALCGLFNGYWVAVVGLPSLAVTLAGLIGYRGAALLLVGDRSIGGFADWFNRLGQQPLIGPFPLALIVFAGLLVGATVLLQFSGFGRYAYVVGSSPEVARFSGVRVRRVKLAVFAMSGLVSAFAGVLLSILVVLNLRNGLALANATGNTQAGVIGALLILSVLVPNLVAAVRSRPRRGRPTAAAAGQSPPVAE